MSTQDDERLAAYLDGAMPADEAARFEAELQRDPALAARAAEWKANDAFIAGAFAKVPDLPIDPALISRMGLAEPALPPAANDNPVWWRRYGLVAGGGALAAGLALVLMLSGQPRPGPAPDPLQVALDTTPSLHTARLADGRTIEPTLTVQASDGRWCREYRSAGDVVLACRSASGWQEVGRGRGAGPQDSGQGTQLAGGEAAPALDPAYARIGASDPLSADEEARMITQKWQGR